MTIKYIDLLRSIQVWGNLDPIELNCCNSSETNFSILRAQLQGKIKYDTSKGAYIDNKIEHDKKCWNLLEYARSKQVDLVVFPEYCISYSVLDDIFKDKEKWPSYRKLWCLPCSGISNEEFESFLSIIQSNPDIKLYKDAYHPRINKKRFVNALFYIFTAFIKGEESEVLCVIPQLKTQHMADGDYQCETVGLTTGDVLYHFNRRLLTLLCADSMNNEITWQELQREELQNCNFLHLQMNPKPKDSTFARIRKEMFEHGNICNYITCNWAKGTTLASADDARKCEKIHNSWSCIYRKLDNNTGTTDDINRIANSENHTKGLFGAYIKNAHVEVWFSTSEEHALLTQIPLLNTDNYAKINEKKVNAEVRLVHSLCANGLYSWTPSEFTFCLDSCINEQDRTELITQIKNHAQNLRQPEYIYPLTTNSKQELDRFVDLSIANDKKSIFEMDEAENPVAWTLLLDENDQNRARVALLSLKKLVSYLEKQCFPKWFDAFNQKHIFAFTEKHDGQPDTNLTSGQQNIIVAFAEDEFTATQYANHLLKFHFHEDRGLLGEKVCVFYKDESDEKIFTCPQRTSDISSGEHTYVKGDVSDGGL